MKNMKKLFAMLLALAMVFALAMPVMAAGANVDTTLGADGKYTITINPSSTNPNTESAKYHVYVAYQILDGSTKIDADTGTATLAGVTWGTNIKTDNVEVEDADGNKTTVAIQGHSLLAALKADPTVGAAFTAVNSAEEFANKISETTFTTAQLEKVAEIINKRNDDGTYLYLTGNPVATTDETDTVPPYELKVEPGYYLIKDKDGSLDRPETLPSGRTEESYTDKDYTDLILRVAQNVNIYHKGSIPSVSKEVSEGGAQYGDAISAAIGKAYYYKLIGTLPQDYARYTSYQYEFVDTLSEGITFDGIVEVYALRESTNTMVQFQPASAGHEGGYTVTQTPNSDGTTTLKISFANLKHDDDEHALHQSDKIIVVYRAKLNENAVVVGEGNINDVYLNYSNDPNGSGTGTTVDDSTKVYTFALEVNKVDGKDNKPMDGVQFVLYREITTTDNTQTTGNEPASQATHIANEYALVSGSNGVYTITGWTIDTSAVFDANGEYKNDVIVSTKDGKVVLNGLDHSVNYFLKEIKTLSGYNLVADPIPVYLQSEVVEGVTKLTTSDHPAISDRGQYAVNNNVLGVYITIPNYQGPVLPSTGGMGTTLFYVFGSIMVLGAIVMLVTKKRMA